MSEPVLKAKRLDDAKINMHLLQWGRENYPPETPAEDVCIQLPMTLAASILHTAAWATAHVVPTFFQ